MSKQQQQHTATKDDNKVTAALAIRNVAAQLKGFDDVLGVSLAAITTPSAFSQNKRTEICKQLRSLRKCLLASAEQLCKNVKVLDPIPSLSYVHARKKELQQPLQDVTNKKRSPQAPSTGPTPPAKRSKKSSPSTVTPRDDGLPTPENGHEFSKLEFCKVVSKASTKQSRSKLVDQVLAAKLVPVGRRCLNKLLAKFDKVGNSACTNGWAQLLVSVLVVVESMLETPSMAQSLKKMGPGTHFCAR
jgi:hypothetical protein